MRVLLYHHDTRVLNDLSRRLRRAAVIVDTTTRAASAARSLERSSYDVAVLDDTSESARRAGRALLHDRRETDDDTPMLLITDETLAGFQAGADDCLAPGFAPEEFVARVIALARRKPLPGGSVLEAGSLRLFPARLVVERRGQSIPLSATQCCVLEALCRHAGQVVDKETLARSCWDKPKRVSENTIAVHIRALRRKLGPPEVILSSRNRGYLLWAEPDESVAENEPQSEDEGPPGMRPLQISILEVLRERGGALSSAQVAAELQSRGWAPTQGEPSDIVHATLFALLRRGQVTRTGDKSRPRFRAATGE